MCTVRNMHTCICTSAHNSSLALTPHGELATCQALGFLLGVHNLSQALIESRVIYNVALPLPEWAAPSCYSPGQSLWPPSHPHPPHTGSHTDSSLRGRRGPFPSFPPTPLFLPFLQAKHWTLGGFASTHPQHYTAQTLGDQSRPSCLARDSQDLDCRSHVFPELQQEKLDLDTRRDFPSELGEPREPRFRVIGEGEVTENLVSCPSILLGN